MTAPAPLARRTGGSIPERLARIEERLDALAGLPGKVDALQAARWRAAGAAAMLGAIAGSSGAGLLIAHLIK